MATLNMALNLPVVGVTAGPTYATLNNTAFSTIDSHDHTTGKGVQVPASGININASLEFNSNAAIELTFLGLEAQSSAPSTNLSVYVDNSSDLYYVNSSGTSVQITNGAALASSGSGVIGFRSVSANDAVATGDAQKIIGVDTGTAVTLTLPAASNEMWFGIKDIAGTAATNNITVTPNTDDKIESGAANDDYIINENYASRMLISDGVSAWYIL
jgi:hypothetical protein